MSRQGATRHRTLESVHQFWNKEALEWGDDPRVTIRDHYFRLLSTQKITGLLRGKHDVLDVGCGSGFATLFYAQVVDKIVGVDYAEEMVRRAQRFLDDRTYFAQTMSRYSPDAVPQLKDNLEFSAGNILALDFPAGSFDAVVAERVLINLPTRNLQDDAVAEVARVLKPGGVWILVEVTEQGHRTVDALRSQFGLPRLEKYWHNLYLDSDHFQRIATKAGFALKQTSTFETYQFLTKVVHAAAALPSEPEFLAAFNNAARKIAVEYPTYKDVFRAGYESFFKERFRALVAAYDPDKLPGYDRVAGEVCRLKPDFSGCSHQVLHLLERRGQ